MKTVRAKFKVASVTKREGWGENPILYDVQMLPVTGENEENKKFFASTPSGELKLSTINPEAAEQLIPGKEYYLDITIAE